MEEGWAILSTWILLSFPCWTLTWNMKIVIFHIHFNMSIHMPLSQKTHPCGSGISLWRETGDGWHGMMASCLCNYLPLWTCSCPILYLLCPSYKGLLLGPPFLNTLSLIEPSLWQAILAAESLAASFVMYSICACPRRLPTAIFLQSFFL